MQTLAIVDEQWRRRRPEEREDFEQREALGHYDIHPVEVFWRYVADYDWNHDTINPCRVIGQVLQPTTRTIIFFPVLKVRCVVYSPHTPLRWLTRTIR